jgi:hypothetical protein
MSLWKLGTGKEITGTARDSFLNDFELIPDDTICDAIIKSFAYAEARGEKYLKIDWKIINGDFKNREVTQKIKIFSGKPESIDRHLNMLRLLMILFSYPISDDIPTDYDLLFFINKIACIKIGEWHIDIIKENGMPDSLEGNNVREVHLIGTFAPETGIEKEYANNNKSVNNLITNNLDSALSRQKTIINQGLMVDDELPF